MRPSPPVLIVLGGLPATGKSTVARELNRDGALSYVRIDSIEQALHASGEMGNGGVQGAGYAVGYAVAGDLLDGGNDVLAECVNPLPVTRDAWRETARAHNAVLIEVELLCSDPAIHRERAESRDVDIPGLEVPDWQAIRAREYHPWDDAGVLRIDTVETSPQDAAAAIRAAVSAASIC
ncbi:AAA family ATPase [Actinomyces qiguomingii]|uniref:AAA family ATPase n=1 Tax=Actinomyces qiguomingii TaxID=2057800 RepID=UPI000CA01579|nr:AAA family ATPase [Actinomyces qiguomingii]